MNAISYLVPTAAICVALIGQTAVSVSSAVKKLTGTPGRHHQTFPFFDYPMYADASGPPITTSTVELRGTLEDGRVIEIDHHYVGLEWFAFRFNVVERLVAEPVDPAKDADLAELVEDHRDEATRLVMQMVAKREGQAVEKLTVDRTVYTMQDGGLIREAITQDAPAVLRLRSEVALPSPTPDSSPDPASPTDPQP